MSEPQPITTADSGGDLAEQLRVSERQRDSLVRRLNERWGQLEEARAELAQVRDELAKCRENFAEHTGAEFPAGRCGAQPHLLTPTSPQYACELPAGHAGWHKDRGAEEPGRRRTGLLEAVRVGLDADQEIRKAAAELLIAEHAAGQVLGWKLGDWCRWIRIGRTPEQPDFAQALADGGVPDAG